MKTKNECIWKPDIGTDGNFFVFPSCKKILPLFKIEEIFDYNFRLCPYCGRPIMYEEYHEKD